MAIYAIAITPLITKQSRFGLLMTPWLVEVSQVLGDDRIVERGPAYGYYPNPTKTCLVVKEGSVGMSKKVFQGTGVSVIGAAIGTQAFVERYVKQKVSEWVITVERLSTFAHTQLQAQTVHIFRYKDIQPSCAKLSEHLTGPMLPEE